MSDFFKKLAVKQQNEAEVNKIFGHSRSSFRFKRKHNPTLLERDGWVLEFFNPRPHNTSDYVIYRQKDLDAVTDLDRIPTIEFNCDNHTLKFNGYSRIAKNIPKEAEDIVREFIEDPKYKTTPIQIEATSYLKMYIAVLDDIPDNIVPTLVAHSVLGAHMQWSRLFIDDIGEYLEWVHDSFRKCVVRVNRKEFEKISKLPIKVYLGHENKTLNGEKSCAVVYPVRSDAVPNVLKFAKLWSPKCQN